MDYIPLEVKEKEEIKQFLKKYNVEPEFGAESDGSAPCDYVSPGIFFEGGYITEEEMRTCWNTDIQTAFGITWWSSDHADWSGLLKHKTGFIVDNSNGDTSICQDLTSALQLLEKFHEELESA